MIVMEAMYSLQITLTVLYGEMSVIAENRDHLIRKFNSRKDTMESKGWYGVNMKKNKVITACAARMCMFCLVGVCVCVCLGAKNSNFITASHFPFTWGGVERMNRNG